MNTPIPDQIDRFSVFSTTPDIKLAIQEKEKYIQQFLVFMSQDGGVA